MTHFLDEVTNIIRFPNSSSSTDAFFKTNPGRPSPQPISASTTNAMELYENVLLNWCRHAEWERDFLSTHLLHGFSMSHHQDYINPKTLLSRASNFGDAIYDTVKKMMADGIINGTEDGKELDLELLDEPDIDDSPPLLALEV